MRVPHDHVFEVARNGSSRPCFSGHGGTPPRDHYYYVVTVRTPRGGEGMGCALPNPPGGERTTAHTKTPKERRCVMSNVSEKRIRQATIVARSMPPLLHRVPGEPFDITRSEVAQWLCSQPEIMQLVFDMVDSSHTGCQQIAYDPETCTWQGRDVP